MYKRQQHYQQPQQPQQQQQPQDAATETLQTLGMRIRQSISNGYKLPEPQQHQYNYMNNYEQQYMENASRRVPLPAHLSMDGPPALDYNGSTASSLSGWEDEINTSNAMRLPNTSFSYQQEQKASLKRGFAAIDTKEMQVSDYVQRYGPLSFNEEF